MDVPYTGPEEPDPKERRSECGENREEIREENRRAWRRGSWTTHGHIQSVGEGRPTLIVIPGIHDA